METVFDTFAVSLAGDGYAIVDQFLSQNDVAAIRTVAATRAWTFKKAGIGKQHQHQVNESIRGDYIHWIDRNIAEPPVAAYLTRVDELIRYLNRTLFLSLKDYELHLTFYPAGAFYKRHLDQFRKDDHRKLSLICYLNDDWKVEHGGQLRIYRPDGPLDILPVGGRVVCFRSDQIEHEVLPATRERYSVTGWLLDRLADLPLPA